MFEFSHPISAHWSRQPMHSPSAVTEHVSSNLAGFFLLNENILVYYPLAKGNENEWRPVWSLKSRNWWIWANSLFNTVKSTDIRKETILAMSLQSLNLVPPWSPFPTTIFWQFRPPSFLPSVLSQLPAPSLSQSASCIPTLWWILRVWISSLFLPALRANIIYCTGVF